MIIMSNPHPTRPNEILGIKIFPFLNEETATEFQKVTAGYIEVRKDGTTQFNITLGTLGGLNHEKMGQLHAAIFQAMMYQASQAGHEPNDNPDPIPGFFGATPVPVTDWYEQLAAVTAKYEGLIAKVLPLLPLTDYIPDHEELGNVLVRLLNERAAVTAERDALGLQLEMMNVLPLVGEVVARYRVALERIIELKLDTGLSDIGRLIHAIQYAERALNPSTE